MNALVKEFEGRLEQIAGWRHHLHKHPELSLEEANTARFIADLVKSWGYDVAEGVGRHGVVASLTAQRPSAYVPIPMRCRSRRTTAFPTRAKLPASRICAVTTGIRRCCSPPVSTWLGLDISTASSG